jgi:UPF0716 protein FxsA
MLLYLFILFTVLPLTEVFLLGVLWDKIGLLPTILVVLGTGIAGAALARWQGLKVIMRIERRLGRGQMPADELFDGAMLLVAGCLLVTPGVLTDLLGLALLLPPVRVALRGAIKSWAKRHVQIRVASFGAGPQQPSNHDPRVVEGEVIDSHFER